MVSKLPTYVVNDFVSVPYRGATFLNIKSGVFERVTITFPSPIGELHFSIKSPELYEALETVSVPYRGATFLNRKILC